MAARRRARRSPGPFTTAVAVALIGVAGAAVAAFVGKWEWPPSPPQGAILQLLDAVPVGTREKPQLELKLLNTGNEVAFITRVELTIANLRSDNAMPVGDDVPSSATYQVELPLPPPILTFPITVSKPLSHEVPGKNDDLLTLSLGVPARSSSTFHTYFLTVKLVYNNVYTNESKATIVVINGRDQA